MLNSITPMDRPPPPPAPRYSNDSNNSNSERNERRQLYTQHPGIGSSASGRPRSGTGGSSDFIFVEPVTRMGNNAPHTGASHTSNYSHETNYSESVASSGGGYGRTPMDDITPCGGPKMMVRPGKPDKPAKSKRSLHMKTPSKHDANGNHFCGKASLNNCNISFQQGSGNSHGSNSDGHKNVGGLQIFDESTRSPWNEDRVDIQLSCMVNQKVHIHSPAQNSLQMLQGSDDSSNGSNSTIAAIIGLSRPSKRMSKLPPPPMWTEKENCINDVRSDDNNGLNGLQRRGAILRQSTSEDETSRGSSNLSFEEDDRMEECHDNCDRTPSGKSIGSRHSDDSFRRKKRTRTESEVSGGSRHSDTPDHQEEGYRRDRRRSSSINTLMHALGVEAGEDDLDILRRSISVGSGDSHRHSSRNRRSRSSRHHHSSSNHSTNSSNNSSSSSSRCSRRRHGGRPKSLSSGDQYGLEVNNDALSRALCTKIVGRMARHGIRLLALDWDLTVLDCHTKNKWWGPSDELAKHIRPLFKHLIQQAISAKITVAIVTFSEQTRFIREALNHSIPNGGSGIIIRGNDQSWDSSDYFDTYFDSDLLVTDDDEIDQNAFGKLPHLASAMRELERRNGGHSIERDDVLLVDDDNRNIMIAGTQRLKTVRFRDSDVNRAFGEMGEMFSQNCETDRNFGSPAVSRTGGGGSMTGSVNSSKFGCGRSRTNSGLRSVSSQLSKK
jgi:nucleoside diphosphate kinase